MSTNVSRTTITGGVVGDAQGIGRKSIGATGVGEKSIGAMGVDGRRDLVVRPSHVSVETSADGSATETRIAPSEPNLHTRRAWK